MELLALTRLLQLASPALPVGAYSYSQGLEWAAESGAVSDERSAASWIGALLAHTLGSCEAPILARLHRSWHANDADNIRVWNAQFIAGRETAELRAETLQMGYSCARLLRDIGALPEWHGRALGALDEASFPAAWSCASAAWGVDETHSVAAYLWTWLENQVMAAIKIVPLGQSAGQRLLHQLGGRLPAIAAHALNLEDDEISNFAPGLAIASSRHETQYSRLFRS